MVLWAGDNNLPGHYRGWTVAIAEKRGCNKQQLTAAYMKLLAWLREYMSVDTVTLLLPAEDRKNLAVCATIGLEEEIAQQIRIPVGRGVAGRIAASGKPKIVDNLFDEEIVSPILRQKGLRSLVGVPIPIGCNFIGVLHVGSHQQRRFNARDIQQLQLVVHRLQSVMAAQSYLF
jgi:signal transduction protein with GAF and PtsI domain